MIKDFYHNGVKTLTVILCVLFSSHFVSAQSCGSIELGDDVEVCSGSSATLTPTEDFKLSGNLESLLAYKGVVSNPSNALGAPDGSGAYFCRGNSGTYTGAVWSVPCNLPSGTKLKIRVKVPSGTAYFKVYGAKDNYSYSSDYTLIACKYVSGSSYQDICVTTNGEFNILKIIDKGCSPFKVDAITFEKTCTATYSWSSGQTTKSITVSPTTTTSYVLTASLCGNTLKDTIEVAVKSCNSGDPTCSKVVGNTRGCSSKPYVIWLKDKNGSAHYLSGDSTDYKWYEYSNGDAKLIATGISASGLSGTFDVELMFAGMTSTPPTNSPKYSSCFSVGSTTGWNYFTTTTGTLTSTNYGTMSLSRKGPAAQIGDGANITQDGYGASGWFNITGGTGHITTGDFNVMLSGCILPIIETSVCVDDTLSLCIDDLVNLDSIYGEDVTVQASTTTSGGAKVTVETGSYTMGVDCCNGNKPNAITYQYVSSNKIDNSQTNSNVTTYTNPNGAKALIIVSGNSTASDTSNPLYRGYVDAGEKFTVIRSQSNKWQANHYIRIMSADGSSLLQFSNIHVSCSQPLVSGEQFGNIVISSVTTNGSTCSGGAPDCESSITYIPANGFTGLDTVSFEVCTSGTNKWCTDIPIVIEVENCNVTPECKRLVTNTVGCAGKPAFVVFMADTSGSGHRFSGDSTKYEWITYSNGDIRFIATDLETGNLNGTFDVNFLWTGHTTTAPTGSPKTSSCASDDSVSSWEYYTTMSGTITSTNYGNMTVDRKGEAFQIGYGANIQEDGFGASGWFNVYGSTFFDFGDVNVNLSTDCIEPTPECKRVVSNTTGCAGLPPFVVYLADTSGSGYRFSGDSTKYEWITYTNGDIRFVATDLETGNLNGTFDVNFLWTGHTNTPPTGSPKTSSCASDDSASSWEYYPTMSGIITSTNYGNMTVDRKGEAFQIGYGANIQEDGFGASGWFNVYGSTFFDFGDVNVNLSTDCIEPEPECKTLIGNTRGCSNKPYVIYLVDKNGAAHHLKGDSTAYEWNNLGNGSYQFKADDISASGLSGTFDVDLTFSGATTTPPTNSPKYSSCFSVGSVNGWVYYPTTTGTITSTSYGTMSISRQGPSFQVGDGANITQDGYGASGWLAITGGSGHIKSGDINIMLYEECDSTDSECDETHTFDPCIVTYGKGSYNNSSTTISITQTVSEIKEIVVEGIYKGGKPTGGSFTNGSSTVTWTGSDAKELDNVSGTSDKGYYQATLPAASSVTMNVSNNQSKMHGMAAYVIMKDEFCADNFTSVSDERYYTYHNTQTSTFSMPATINEKTITAVLPIAEMNNDTRIAVFTLTAGSASESVTINSYDLGRSMTLQTLTLNDVPGGVTSATLTMSSPSSNGDSYVTGSAMFNWYLPCETNSGKNRIAGTVFFDADRDTTLDNDEDGEPGVMVYLYDDKDDDGMFDDNELTPIDSVLSASDGTFEFFVDYVCNEGYINNVEYQSSIDNPNNMLGEPDGDYATYNNNADNLIVELDGTIKDGETYSIFLRTIESGAYAIISESTDGINFYHNDNIAILTSSSGEYSITADRDVNYIKFDKNTINTIAGYNSYGSTSTNSSDYGIHGIEFCKGINSFLIDTDLNTYPDSSELTTDNYEFAQFDGPNQEDIGNDFGFNGDVFIDGYVFYDTDSSGTFDNGESGTTDITVYLYIDLDCDGVLDANETTAIESAETNSAGYYSFTRPYLADLNNLPEGWDNCYIMISDVSDYPTNHNMTTDNIEVAEFDGFDQEDLNNNFGHVKSAPLNYCGKLEITIDKNKVDGSSGHENFPVYLDLTHSAFKYRQNWPYSWDQGMFNPNGYDVQVCNANGDELPIEIVGYDSTSGNIKMWVQVDKLSSTDNTILTVKHGVSSGTVSNPSTTAVWGSDYKAVYHFEDLNDATSNDNDATNYGSSLATGQIGSSVDLDGNDHLLVPYSSSLDIGGKKLTMSAWVNVAPSPSSDAPFAVKGPTVNQEAYMFGVDGGTNPVKINSRVTTNNGHYRHDDGALGTNQWVYVQFVYDGDLGSGQKRVYVNGSLSHTKSASGDINTGSHDLYIGKRIGSDNRYLTGKIDELRITCAATSADWISTEYNNQLSPTTFATITDSSGCGAVPVTWLEFTAKKVSANDVELNWSTASEINNSHFEVERSFNGTDFVTIGSPVQGAGNSSQIERYDAMDYDLPEGVAYYRVKQIDFDGQYDYTPVRVVEVLSRNAMVVYPNPANNEVNISFKGAKGQEVVVTNLMGQVLETVVLSREGFATINTTDYPHGVYFIEVQGANMVKTQKFTIEK